ncbi:multiple sugar transport system ATP-binding protein [Barrientosiimonas humi]|uniref:Multiple sugar transport system ATP-binding protein n=1 Tax=Barrientosiimonas humi TaxID=999931 RepID=A0A542XDE6_9MICO|nr:sn-glycerol-3-phosphate ABC transporter ATP-binding protein UgpC [Barrientosiimonas humi]TQL33863.1 multiple sugar transport system ATP-binding protein [Barrientosiimonas humi]CAG7573854.1 Trehalose import ATP-binding protein SugC [Barrientosiimonas humi]
MANVVFDQATLQYPSLDAPTIDGLDLQVEDGEFVCVVGPSGCGKSTTIRMLAGLEFITGGRVYIGGEDVSAVAPRDRDIAMVFQNYALYPHMSVADNIGFHLRLNKTPKEEIRRRVREAAALLDLEEFLDRKPANLSGGQRQRVAMGRAIVRHPKVFLMDEPLSNLDAKLRVQTRTQISELQRRLGVTTMYVTHDQVEAMTMADRIAVLRAGVLQQYAPPEEMYARPANVFVAGFIGSPSMNLLTAPVGAQGQVRYGTFDIQLTRTQQAALTSDRVVVGSRPEGFRVLGHGEPGVHARVDVVENLGNDVYIYLSTEEAEPKKITVRRPAGARHTVGEGITLRPARSAMHLFDAETGERLPDYDGDREVVAAGAEAV